MEFSTSIHHSKSKPDCNGKVEYILIWKVSSFFHRGLRCSLCHRPCGIQKSTKKIGSITQQPHQLLINTNACIFQLFYSFYMKCIISRFCELQNNCNLGQRRHALRDGMPFAFFNMHSIKDFQLHQARRMTKKGKLRPR